MKILLLILLSSLVVAQNEITDQQILDILKQVIQIAVLIYIIRYLMNILRVQLLGFKKKKR